MARRKRGAQPGNRNAHKHGFYSAAVSTSMRNALRRARGIDDNSLAAEIALARARLYECLKLEPSNHDVLLNTIGMIARMVSINAKLDHHEEKQLGEAMQEMLAELMPAQ